MLLQALALLPADLAWRFEHIGRRRGAGRCKARPPSSALPSGSTGRRARAAGGAGALPPRRHLRAGLPDRRRRRPRRPAERAGRSGKPAAGVRLDDGGRRAGTDQGRCRGAAGAARRSAALAAALVRLIREPALRARLGAHAERRVRAELRPSWQHRLAHGAVRRQASGRVMAGPRMLLLCPASARHRPSRARQPHRPGAAARRFRPAHRDRRAAGCRLSAARRRACRAAAAQRRPGIFRLDRRPTARPPRRPFWRRAATAWSGSCMPAAPKLIV